MTVHQLTHKQSVSLDPGGPAVPLNARVTYLFEEESQRTRFAQFIATGLVERDKCIIATDPRGKLVFCEALEVLGINVAQYERDEALILITDDVSVESIEPIAQSILEDAVRRFRFMRCINDSSWMANRGWNSRQFLRFEVKGHLLTQHQPCTVICQYDTNIVDRSHLQQIIAAHQFNVTSSRLEKNPDRRPLGQIIFDGMDEQLRILTQLQDLSLKLTASLTPGETLDAIIDAVVTICNANSAAISYIDDAGELRLMRHFGLSEEYIKARKITRNDPLVMKFIETKQPIIIEDIEEATTSLPNYSAWKSAGIRSIVTLPLVSDGEVFGIVSAGSNAPRRYSPTELDAMAILTAQASAAITNARLFEQLLDANRAKDRFLASLSHELRTPLTPILGWMHILNQFAPLDPMLAQGLETIERNARQQAELINELLDLTRITSGKFGLEREPTNIVTLVQSAVEQIRPQADARRIGLELSVSEEVIISDVDPLRIQQVMSNLLGNAIKFTPDGGKVSVSLRCERLKHDSHPPQVVIEVVDNGIGIPQEFIPHVFERFSQADTGITRRYGGLGLGLAITQALVEMHGGEVSAESAGPDKGSCFTVRLAGSACKTELDQGETTDALVETWPEFLGLKVLLIEDSHDTLNMLKLWLDSCGCEVWMAARAADGLKIASKDLPDLIISDIGMPDIDGYDLIRRLRKIPGLKDVPAIALTGYAREEDRELAMAAGYNAHIAKPADMRHLLYLMKKLTTRHPL